MTMLKLLLAFSLTVFVVSARRGSLRPRKYGPKAPIGNYTAEEVCEENKQVFVADVSNVCWYWECVDGEVLQPRRCALGSKMDDSYLKGKENPCTENFDADIAYDCTRVKAVLEELEEPECNRELVCFNGGTNRYLYSYCWCECPEEWKGNHDCSLPTDSKMPVVVHNSTCIGYPKSCDAEASLCLNGGTCMLQCNQESYCLCPTPYTNGKRCEGFSCDDNPCQNGGTCNRGEENRDEISQCLCPPSYEGQLCEVNRN